MAVEAKSYTLGRARQQAGAFVRAGPVVVPALVAVGVLIALAATEAGFHARHWYAAGLFLLAAYTAWSYLSIAWADQPGPAWDGANRTAMYLVLVALFALWPLTG